MVGVLRTIVDARPQAMTKRRSKEANDFIAAMRRRGRLSHYSDKQEQRADPAAHARRNASRQSTIAMKRDRASKREGDA